MIAREVLRIPKFGIRSLNIIQARRFSTGHMRACQISEQGGDAGSLSISKVPIPVPGPGEILIRNRAAGLNFIDTYHRSGLYPRPTPFILGVEGAGTIEKIGENVDPEEFYRDLNYAGENSKCKDLVGVNVGYYGTDTYAEYSIVPYTQAFPVPEGESFSWNEIIACVTQGLTAHYLTRSTYKLGPSDTCLVHAAAGGTGQFIVQMAKKVGAKVIGTCSTDKVNLARSIGADHVIDYSNKDLDIASKVRDITGGSGVQVVYDGVGARTWESSLDSLCPRGMAVFFGNASGPVPKIDPLVLNAKGSLFMTRPKLYDYIANRDEFLWRVNETLNWIKQKDINVSIDREFPLEKVVDAHKYIESGKTTGKVIINIERQ